MFTVASIRGEFSQGCKVVRMIRRWEGSSDLSARVSLQFLESKRVSLCQCVAVWVFQHSNISTFEHFIAFILHSRLRSFIRLSIGSSIGVSIRLYTESSIGPSIGLSIRSYFPFSTSSFHGSLSFCIHRPGASSL